jgi:hypothetical protein
VRVRSSALTASKRDDGLTVSAKADTHVAARSYVNATGRR